MRSAAPLACSNTVLAVDIFGNRMCEIADPGSSGFTERHHCRLLEESQLQPDADLPRRLRSLKGCHVVLLANYGIPGVRLLRTATRLRRTGNRVYLYWPKEGALEVVDAQRLASFWRHRIIVAFLRIADRARDSLSRKADMFAQTTRTLRRAVSHWAIWLAALPARLKSLLMQPAAAPRRIAGYLRQLAARLASLTGRSARQLRQALLGLQDAIPRPLRSLARRVRGHAGRLGRRLLDRRRARQVTRRLGDPTGRPSMEEAARLILGEAHFGAGTLPSKSAPIDGAGAYVRLDYWARLKTGGSYGHTCFLAKAAADACRDFRCFMANRYDLLDTLGVPQDLLPHEFTANNSSELIHFGTRFEVPLAERLTALAPRFVYERSVLGSAAAAKWCAMTGTPYILEYNGSEIAMARSFGSPMEQERQLEAIEDYTFKVATLINVISEPVAESLVERGVPRAKILVNPNAVAPDTYKPMSAAEKVAARHDMGLAETDIVVGFSGTFGGWHGIEVLAEAMPHMARHDPRVKFLMIGDGNLKHLVREAVATNNLEDRVVDLGLVPQLQGARALAVCDILLAPHSRNIDGRTFFGSPTKLFEYLAVGAAVVASDLAQLGEVMRPALTAADIPTVRNTGNERGVLVTPGSCEELVHAVTGLVDRPELRRQLGLNGRAAVMQNYTWDIHVENIWRYMMGMPLKGYQADLGSKAVTGG